MGHYGTPVDFAVRIVAARTTIRLWETDWLTNLGTGHPDRTDYCTTDTAPRSFFSAHFPSRDEWAGQDFWRRGAVKFIMDGSKLDGRVGGGVFCRELSINTKFRPPDFCSVFQAEVAAIKEAVDSLLRSVITVREVSVYSDSKAAIYQGLQFVRGAL